MYRPRCVVWRLPRPLRCVSYVFTLTPTNVVDDSDGMFGWTKATSKPGLAIRRESEVGTLKAFFVY